MSENVTLNNVTMRQAVGQKSTMPSSAPDGQLLVARTSGYPTELYCGTGSGVERISMGYNNFTNCIIETPQNLIWEEIENGVRLKAGSKITVPNSFEQNGTTLKFNTIVTTEDLDCIYTGSSTAQYFIVYRTDNATLTRPSVAAATSGNTAPTGTGLWYDTTTNKVKYYSGGTLSFDNASLPLGLFNAGTKRLTRSFNHIGFIGTYQFSLPGIKILKADGRNSDGTLKNTVITTNTVSINAGGESDTLDYLRLYTDGKTALIRDRRYFQVNTISELPNDITSTSLHVAFVRDENQWYFLYGTAGITKWTIGSYMVLNCTFNITDTNPIHIYNINNIPEPISLLSSDLQNIDRTGIDNLQYYAHALDYDNLIEVSTTNDTDYKTFTPTVDGLLLIQTYASGGSKVSKVISQSISINNIVLQDTRANVYYSTQCKNIISAPVPKGVEVKYYSYAHGGATSNTTLVDFIPFKKS